MSGIISRGVSSSVTPVLQNMATERKAESTTAPTAAADMADTRSPVTRASTMLSPRRRREDEMRPTVGTKQLLGQ